jgi:hypothetical protein
VTAFNAISSAARPPIIMVMPLHELSRVMRQPVLLGQRPGDAQGPAARHDGDLVDRVVAGQQVGDDRVAGLVVRRVASAPARA